MGGPYTKQGATSTGPPKSTDDPSMEPYRREGTRALGLFVSWDPQLALRSGPLSLGPSPEGLDYLNVGCLGLGFLY